MKRLQLYGLTIHFLRVPVFLDGWLLERLKVFNQKTVAVPSTWWKGTAFKEGGIYGIEYNFTVKMDVSNSKKANEVYFLFASSGKIGGSSDFSYLFTT